MISRMFAIALKDLRLLSRDRGALFFTILFPVIIAVLFGMVFGRVSTPGPLDVVVVVTEDGPLARSFTTALQDDSALHVQLAQDKGKLGWNLEVIDTRHSPTSTGLKNDFKGCFYLDLQ